MLSLLLMSSHLLLDACSALLARTTSRLDSAALQSLHVRLSHASSEALLLIRHMHSRAGVVGAVSSLSLVAGICAAWTHSARLGLTLPQSPVCQGGDLEEYPSSLALCAQHPISSAADTPPSVEDPTDDDETCGDGLPGCLEAPTNNDETCGDELPGREPTTPPQYEPFKPAEVKAPNSIGHGSPDSPITMLPNGTHFSRTALGDSFGQASTSSGSVPTSRGSQLSQRWMTRSPESDYVPFGGGAPQHQPSTAGGVSHDYLCAALVEAVTAVREEANAEKEEALAAVRAQAGRELSEAVNASRIEVETVTAPHVSNANTRSPTRTP